MEASLERAGYTDVSRLGAGSFGSVFLGRKQTRKKHSSRNDPPNSSNSDESSSEGEGAVVALKRLTATTAPHRVVLEMQLLRQAAHGSEFVPAVLDGFHDTDGFVIVMEYFEHDDFKSYYDKLTWPQLQQYAHQLFSALAHVHSRGVIHRDVKPRNFLFHVASGRGRLVDFGLAQPASLWKSREEKLAQHRQQQQQPRSHSQQPLDVEVGSNLAWRARSSQRSSNNNNSSSSSSSAVAVAPTSVLANAAASAAPGIPAAKTPRSASRKRSNLGPASSTAAATPPLKKSSLGLPPSTVRGNENALVSNPNNPVPSPEVRTAIISRATSSAATSTGTDGATAAIDSAVAGDKIAAAPASTNDKAQVVAPPSLPPPLPPPPVIAEPANGLDSNLPKRPDRAGTPGFRAPEVLLGSAEQSVALDVWSAGAVLLALVARRYPFFPPSARGDEAALLQLAHMLGPAKMQRAAQQLKRQVDLPSDLSVSCSTSAASLASTSSSGASATMKKKIAPLGKNHSTGNGSSSSSAGSSSTKTGSCGSDSGTAPASGYPPVPLGDLFAPALQPSPPDGTLGELPSSNSSNTRKASSSSGASKARGDEESDCARVHPLASDFLQRTLEPSPFERVTAAGALLLPFISDR